METKHDQISVYDRLTSFQPTDRKRIFLLGPSHHHPLSNVAFSQLSGYETPLSPDPLPIDTALISHLKADNPNTTCFTTMSQPIDEAEHSLELHLPYIHRLLQRLYPSAPTSSYPPLVPMMVGNKSATTEKAVGSILAPYLADPENAFVISSDFCHWGARFGYTYYIPSAQTPAPDLPLSGGLLPQPSPGLASTAAREEINAVSSGQMLRSKDRVPRGAGVPAIHESISACDKACMSAIACGKPEAFLAVLRNTGNTVCGRHPIGVIMAAIQEMEHAAGGGDGDGDGDADVARGRFNFTRYERSSDAISISDSSVSYVSAYAVL